MSPPSTIMSTSEMWTPLSSPWHQGRRGDTSTITVRALSTIARFQRPVAEKLKVPVSSIGQTLSTATSTGGRKRR
jgi:hypothetical protein